MFEYENVIKKLDESRTKKIIAFTGAGGKTSTMFALARHYANQGMRVAITTTTKIYRPQISEGMNLVTGIDRQPQDIAHGEIAIYGTSINTDGKLTGFAPEMIEAWDENKFDILLYEADGARMRAIKAPREDEPRILETTTHVIGCIGLDVLGQAICEKVVHRLPLFLNVTASREGDILEWIHFKRLIEHPNGLFQHTPVEAERICLLTKADTQFRIQQAKILQSEIESNFADVLYI